MEEKRSPEVHYPYLNQGWIQAGRTSWCSSKPSPIHIEITTQNKPEPSKGFTAFPGQCGVLCSWVLAEELSFELTPTQGGPVGTWYGQYKPGPAKKHGTNLLYARCFHMLLGTQLIFNQITTHHSLNPPPNSALPGHPSYPKPVVPNEVAASAAGVIRTLCAKHPLMEVTWFPCLHKGSSAALWSEHGAHRWAKEGWTGTDTSLHRPFPNLQGLGPGKYWPCLDADLFLCAHAYLGTTGFYRRTGAWAHGGDWRPLPLYDISQKSLLISLTLSPVKLIQSPDSPFSPTREETGRGSRPGLPPATCKILGGCQHPWNPSPCP